MKKRRSFKYVRGMKAPRIAGASSYAPVRLSYQPRPGRRMYDPTFAFLLPAARKRAPRVWQAQLFAKFIRLRLMPDVILNPGLILACCIDVILTAPKFPIAVFELQIPKLFTDHETALTLQIAHKTRHTHFGGNLKQHVTAASNADLVYQVFILQIFFFCITTLL